MKQMNMREMYIFKCEALRAKLEAAEQGSQKPTDRFVDEVSNRIMLKMRNNQDRLDAQIQKKNE